MSEHYILQGKTPVVADLLTWAHWLENNQKQRIVAQTGSRAKVQVSTVFLGLDHNFYGGPPHIFETMIFGGDHDDEMWRCSTWQQTEAQHTKACKLVGLRSPFEEN